MEPIVAFLAVAAGGFFGGLARWALNKIPRERVGTFAANVVGSALLGIAVTGPGIIPLALGVGFAGGLSTWSTLSREIGGLLRARQWRTLITYVAATVFIGLIAAHRGTVWGERIFAYF